MKTETATATETIVASEPKLAKTFTITLTANGHTLTLVAERLADGAKTYALVTDDQKHSSRGFSATHESFEDAKAATMVASGKAEKLGWVRRAPRIGFLPKADAFSALPKAPKAAKK